jgi:hypothetical protein
MKLNLQTAERLYVADLVTGLSVQPRPGALGTYHVLVELEGSGRYYFLHTQKDLVKIYRSFESAFTDVQRIMGKVSMINFIGPSEGLQEAQDAQNFKLTQEEYES